MQHESENPVLAPLIAELNRSIDLIEAVPELLFREPAEGSIGAHIRHDLDFVGALLRGVQTGSIDYSARERDGRTETDKRYAIRRVRAAIGSVAACSRIDPGTLLAVRSEADPTVRHRSSFSREVEFVYSHMVHHHALISERLKGYGLALPSGLGIAPSTRAHWDSLALAA